MAEAIYLIIKDLIINEIKDKPVNSPIDSERELALKYKTSRMTARKAVNALVVDGYLYRDKNKGTFVADPKLRRKNTSAVSFESSEDDSTYKILYFNIKEAGSDTSARLEIPVDELVLRIVRLSTKKNAPQCVEEINICKNDIDIQDMEKLKTVLDLNQYANEGSITQTFIPMLVPVQYANLLHLKINVPIIMVDTIVTCKNGRPLMHMKSYDNPLEKIIEITI
ncbi:MAG: GntR family transcriptional regulator [Erysipelotrichaceae bacterium]